MLDPEKVKTPDTDEWWITRLARKIGFRITRMRELESWMNGEPPQPYPDSAAASFHRLQRYARLNLAELVVNAVLYRMTPVAFKTASSVDGNGDDMANEVWKINDMKVVSNQIIEWMLGLSESYACVGQIEDEKGKNRALITAEHPAQMITEDDPTQPGKVIAALKIYRDDIQDKDIAVLYRPGYTRVAYHVGGTLLPGKFKIKSWQVTPRSWDWEGEPEASFMTDEVPVYHFLNRNGKGEFEKHIPALERINHTILQRMIIVAFQAFKQRAIKGVPALDKDGHQIDYSDIFTSDPGALWLLPAVAEMWESGQADIGPILQAVKDDIAQLATATMTPLHLITPDAAAGSAEGAALQREALIFKTEDCISRADSAFTGVMHAAFLAMGETARADKSQIEVVWASPRRSSLTEKAASAAQAAQGGMPWRMRMEKFFELTPSEIAEAETQRQADALLAPPAPTISIGGNHNGSQSQSPGSPSPSAQDGGSPRQGPQSPQGPKAPAAGRP